MGKKKHKGGRGKKSIPVLPMLPAIGAVYGAYGSAGNKLGVPFVNELSKNLIGLNPSTGAFTFSEAMPFWLGEGVAIVGHMVANKTGINAHVRRATMGFLSL
jgi:hypothetical protein